VDGGRIAGRDSEGAEAARLWLRYGGGVFGGVGWWRWVVVVVAVGREGGDGVDIFP